MLSSQRSFRGNLKPCGGGPAGVAARKALDEKAAMAGVGNGREVREDLGSLAEGRLRAAIIVTDFVDAMSLVRRLWLTADSR